MSKKKVEKPVLKTLSQTSDADTQRISCGIPSVDRIMGGGIPVGRQIEVFGPESAGKTSFCLTAIAHNQESIECAFCDAEGTTDIDFACNIFGIDPETLYYERPESGEVAISWIEESVRKGCRLIVCDSVAALVPTAELEGEISDHHVATQARLVAKAMRKLVILCNRKHATILWINQTRDEIGGYGYNPEITPGGKALKFFASIRMRVSNVSVGDGRGTKFVTRKNKTAIPYKECKVPFFKEGGYDLMNDLIDEAYEYDILTMKKKTYFYKGKKIGTHKKLLKKLRASPNMVSNIKKRMIKSTEKISESMDIHI